MTHSTLHPVKKGRGKFYSDLVFRKKVRRSIHFMKIKHSWAIDADIVEDLISKCCQQVEIYEEESGNTFVCDFQEFASAVPENWGDNLQCFVPQEKFNLK